VFSHAEDSLDAGGGGAISESAIAGSGGQVTQILRTFQTFAKLTVLRHKLRVNHKWAFHRRLRKLKQEVNETITYSFDNIW